MRVVTGWVRESVGVKGMWHPDGGWLVRRDSRDVRTSSSSSSLA